MIQVSDQKTEKTRHVYFTRNLYIVSFQGRTMVCHDFEKKSRCSGGRSVHRCVRQPINTFFTIVCSLNDLAYNEFLKVKLDTSCQIQSKRLLISVSLRYVKIATLWKKNYSMVRLRITFC